VSEFVEQNKPTDLSTEQIIDNSSVSIDQETNDKGELSNSANAVEEDITDALQLDLSIGSDQENIVAAMSDEAATINTPLDTLDSQPPLPKQSWWVRFREQNPDFEKFIGENLINKIGILILVL